VHTVKDAQSHRDPG